ncbi:N-6 DNA methylase [Klebsiella variicola]|uniref:site-specific DNA-methyltransferase (adenine-specific) n=1 Tax=Klebsiella variicola TaxID=244366 RepID=A0ABD7PEX7_KLEVA|nr:type I restriction-modification system subunit M N-terminal domain-containing protein [Klebsiella variicola]SXF99809.1 N-6 DNA methylase [Klebsiella variicola]
MQKKQQQDQSQIKWISDFIWNIADDRLRDVYVRGKYRDVILPFTVLRRLDAVLEATKDAVLERKKLLDAHKVVEQDGALRMAAGQAFYNVSEFTLAKLKASACVMILSRIWMVFRPTSRKSSPSSVSTTRFRSWWILTF